MPEVWMMSFRQPWIEALLQGWITHKTRSKAVNLPPAGAIVFLHASKALWSGWRDLWWAEQLDVPSLPRGGVLAVARLIDTGLSDEMIPPRERQYFKVGSRRRDCADVQCLWFGPPVQLRFYPCRGVLVPTRKVPAPLMPWVPSGWGKIKA